MKHDLKITLLLIFIFISAQLIGLLITTRYLDQDETARTGKAEFSALPFNTERPDVEESQSFIWIMMGVLLGTVLVLLLIKFRKLAIWRIWFLLSVTLCLTVAFSAFMPDWMAFIIALTLGLLKIFRPTILIHNTTELFIYGGMAAIFAPIINVFSAVMLLLLISAYDIYAVWKSKHMIKMAEFQSQSRLFAGLMIPYHKKDNVVKIEKKSQKPVKGKKTEKVRNAILGGGDIGFPLIFAGVVLKTLVAIGVNIYDAFLQTLIITGFTTIALAFLLFKSREDKFYPAMPFLSAGCFIGYGIVWLINLN